jgi:hypothetical protein
MQRRKKTKRSGECSVKEQVCLLTKKSAARVSACKSRNGAKMAMANRGRAALGVREEDRLHQILHAHESRAPRSGMVSRAAKPVKASQITSRY